MVKKQWLKSVYLLKKILTNTDSCSILKIQVGLYPEVDYLPAGYEAIAIVSLAIKEVNARRQRMTSVRGQT